MVKRLAPILRSFLRFFCIRATTTVQATSLSSGSSSSSSKRSRYWGFVQNVSAGGGTGFFWFYSCCAALWTSWSITFRIYCFWALMLFCISLLFESLESLALLTSFDKKFRKPNALLLTVPLLKCLNVWFGRFLFYIFWDFFRIKKRAGGSYNLPNNQDQPIHSPQYGRPQPPAMLGPKLHPWLKLIMF